MVLPRRITAPLVRQTAINANADLRRSNSAFKPGFWSRKEMIRSSIERHASKAACHTTVLKPPDKKEKKGRAISGNFSSAASSHHPTHSQPTRHLTPDLTSGGSGGGGGGGESTSPSVAVLINHVKAQNHEIWMEGLHLYSFAFPPFSPIDLVTPPSPSTSPSTSTLSTPPDTSAHEISSGIALASLTSPRGQQQPQQPQQPQQLLLRPKSTVFNKMKKTKEGITSLYVSLKALSLSHNLLSSLPSMLFFTYLQDLYLAHNDFTSFPKDILHLTGLVKLDLSYNRIDSIPGLLTKKLATLKLLHLHHNRIEYIPAHVTSALLSHHNDNNTPFQLLIDANPLLLPELPTSFAGPSDGEGEQASDSPDIEGGVVLHELEFERHCMVPSLVAISAKHILRTHGGHTLATIIARRATRTEDGEPASEHEVMPESLAEYLQVGMNRLCDFCGKRFLEPAFAWQKRVHQLFGYDDVWVGARTCSYQCGRKLWDGTRTSLVSPRLPARGEEEESLGKATAVQQSS